MGMVRNFIQTTESTEPKMLHERPGETPKHEIPPPPRIIVLSRSSPQILVICQWHKWLWRLQPIRQVYATPFTQSASSCHETWPKAARISKLYRFIAIKAMYASQCKQECSCHHERLIYISTLVLSTISDTT